MPALRPRRTTRQTRRNDDEGDVSNVLVTTNTYADTPLSDAPTSPQSVPAEDLLPPSTKAGHNKKKSSTHIPRPPNAFILFRSAFIKSQQVSSDVETSHSTLSKIIGLTWQNLSEEERQHWHDQAKIAQAEHKRRYPSYAFRPVHSKPRGSAAEKRKVREAGTQDQKRCEKIAELLVHGVKGDELKFAIDEFDRNHVPEIVTRFEAPITARSFSDSHAKPSKAKAPSAKRNSVPPQRQRKTDPRQSRSPSVAVSLAEGYNDSDSQPPAVYVEQEYQDHNPSFDISSFSYSSIHSYSPSPISFSSHAMDAPVFDQTLIPPNPRPYTTLCDQWNRSHSPLSTSSVGMPATPPMVGIAFPDSFHAYPSSSRLQQHQHVQGPEVGFGNFPSQQPSYPQSFMEDNSYALPPASSFQGMPNPMEYDASFKPLNSALHQQTDEQYSGLFGSLHAYDSLTTCQ